MKEKVEKTTKDTVDIKSQLKLDEKKFYQDCKELEKQLDIAKHEK
jgi:hypothetical protein